MSHLLPPQPPTRLEVTPPEPRRTEDRRDSFSGPPFSRYDRPRRPAYDSHTAKQSLGIAGGALLAVGVFCPIVSVPVIGSMNYFQNGKGDGSIVLGLAIATAILTGTKKFRLLWFTGGGSLALLIFAIVRFQAGIGEARRQVKVDLRDNPFAGLAEMAVRSVATSMGSRRSRSRGTPRSLGGCPACS